MIHPIVQHQAVQAGPGLAAVYEGAEEGISLGQVVTEELGEMPECEMLQ